MTDDTFRPGLSSKAVVLGIYGSAVCTMLTFVITIIFSICWTIWKRGFKVRVTPCPFKSPFYIPSYTIRNESLSSPPETKAWTYVYMLQSVWQTLAGGSSYIPTFNFFKYFLINFFQRERESGRERETTMQEVNTARHPYQGSSPQPRHLPWPGIELATL